MNRWIKLYVKLWDSPMFQGYKNKGNMILVFIWWLTHAKEGKCTFGRHQIHRDTGLNSSSVQRAISNLALSVREVNYQPNNPFSTVLILNWHKYQDKPIEQPISNRSATEQQPITNKNIEYISKDILEDLQKQFPTKSVFAEYETAKDWKANHPKRQIVNWVAFMRNWLRKSPDNRIPPKHDAEKIDYAPVIQNKELTEEQRQEGLENLKKLNKGDLIKSI